MLSAKYFNECWHSLPDSRYDVQIRNEGVLLQAALGLVYPRMWNKTLLELAVYHLLQPRGMLLTGKPSPTTHLYSMCFTDLEQSCIQVILMRLNVYHLCGGIDAKLPPLERPRVLHEALTACDLIADACAVTIGDFQRKLPRFSKLSMDVFEFDKSV